MHLSAFVRRPAPSRHSSAVRTIGESSVCTFAPIGRMPIVSNFTVIFAGDFGHRAVLGGHALRRWPA